MEATQHQEIGDILKQLFTLQVFGNTLISYVVAAASFLGALLALRFLRKFVFARLKAMAGKTTSRVDDFLVDMGERTLLPVLHAAAFYFSAHQLTLNVALGKLVDAFCLIVLTIQVLRCAMAVLLVLMEQIWIRRASGDKSASAAPISKSLVTILRVVVWGLGVVFVLDNLGFNVSAVVAGLGIGGVAVALAAQTILGDLFNYFVIFFDRPFEEGDFIVFDDFMGQIENIGIKSTKIRSLGGEQIVISNSNLTNSKIRNYKRMAQLRVLFRIGIVYETPSEKLKKIPVIIRQLIEAEKGAKFDRAHFASFGSFSLDIEVVYFVTSADYNRYMDIQQSLNLAIKEAFEKEGIEFAYPTQVEYVRSYTPAPSETPS